MWSQSLSNLVHMHAGRTRTLVHNTTTDINRAACPCVLGVLERAHISPAGTNRE